MPARALSGAGAIIILVGAAAIAYAVTRKATGEMSPAQTEAMGGAVAQLDREIATRRAEVHGRASALSEQPVVRRAVATDQSTVADMVKGGEIAFAPANGELVEL